MGYILPLTFYQYQHYQDRIKGVNIDSYRTSGIDRVKKAYLVKANSFSKEKEQEAKGTRKQSGSGADKVFAQITGIGRVVDERI